jgi:hypothetical protein
MDRMTILAYLGGVAPDVYDEMDPGVADELARRLLEMKHQELKERYEFDVKMTEILAKASGAKIF